MAELDHPCTFFWPNAKIEVEPSSVSCCHPLGFLRCPRWGVFAGWAALPAEYSHRHDCVSIMVGPLPAALAGASHRELKNHAFRVITPGHGNHLGPWRPQRPFPQILRGWLRYRLLGEEEPLPTRWARLRVAHE